MTTAEMLTEIMRTQKILVENLWLSNLLAIVGRLMEIGIGVSLAMIYSLKVRQYRLQLDTMALIREVRELSRRRPE